ncbi:MAG: 23S rRNA (uracil(1939)-C(5))-methyltransferase RlmD, partial [Cyclobacteriaceae bacterium]
RVIFMTNTVPGDVVDIQTTKKRKAYFEGTTIKFHSYSDKRTEPKCEHFGVCGGCKWQHINYQTQLTYKRQEVKDQLERVAKVSLPEIAPIVPAPKTEYYRNKLEFTFSNRRWLSTEEIQSGKELVRKALGFHKPRMFDKIVDIEHCHLQPEPSNTVRLALKDFALEKNLSFYDPVKKAGLLRNLIIRTTDTEQLMVIVQFGQFAEAEIDLVMAFVKDKFPEITSLYYVINTKGNDTFLDLEVIHYHGSGHIEEQMSSYLDPDKHLRFMIGPKSFYQTNTQQAYQLYRVVADLAGLSGKEVVYDLYTGTGTIALFLAELCKKVIGLEYVNEAIEDAQQNAQINKIENAYFRAGDIKDLLQEEMFKEFGAPDLIIADPPRMGMHPKVVNRLLEIAVPRIVYVSCNPATQARDIALLDPRYEVSAVQPLDMFPHTHHVENVVLLELRD